MEYEKLKEAAQAALAGRLVQEPGARERSELESTMARIGGVLDHLEHGAGKLVSRLEPVMRQEPPRNGEDAPTQRVLSSVPLVSALLVIEERIAHIALALDAVHSKLAL